MRTLLLATIAATALYGGAAYATPSNVSGGGLNFTNFTCQVTTNSGFAAPVNCNGLGTSFTAPNNLTITGQVQAGLLTPPTGGQEDITIKYQASATSGLISAVDMNFNGVSVSNAIASVTESVGTSFGALNDLGQIIVKTPTPLSVGPIPLSTAEATVFVTKDIALNALVLADLGGTAVFSVINQSFEHTGVPEPASLLLLGAGLVGLGMIGRRRS